MVWPHLIPKTLSLPLDAEKNEQILQLDAPKVKRNEPNLYPIIVLTDRSLHLLDHKHHTLISSHNRSEESIENYGKNISFKRNLQDDLVVIRTDADYLLVYTVLRPQDLTTSQNNELLAVYSKSSGIVQNGLVLETQQSLFDKHYIEDPIYKYSLRFRLFLKISHSIVDYLPLNTFELLLITNANVQLIELLQSEASEIVNLELEGKPQKVITTKDGSDIFFVINEDGSIHQYIRNRKTIKKSNSIPVEYAVNVSVNENFKLLSIITSNQKLIQYNYDTNQVVSEVQLNYDVKNIRWSSNGTTLLVLYDEGHWQFLSTYGCTKFDSSDHDNKLNWLTQIIDIDISLNDEYLVLSDGTKFYISQLIKQVDNQINHNIHRPILISKSEIHIYSGHEMNSVNSGNKLINWNVFNIPYDEYHQLSNVQQVSLSQDYKLLALSDTRNLLIYSFNYNHWVYYINDYNHTLNIDQLTWIDSLNLLIVTNNTSTHSEIVMFDFRKLNKDFTEKNNFDSDSIVFKYDFNSNIKLLNTFGNDVVVLTEDDKYYHFHIEILKTSFKIDLLKVLSFDKVLKPKSKISNILRVDSNDKESQDLLVLQNGELLFFKQNQDRSYEKFLLFEKVEYIYKIKQDEYFFFNGESLYFIKDFKKLVKTRDPSNSVLKISRTNTESQDGENSKSYPLLLVSERAFIVSLENEIIEKKSSQVNNLITKNSVILHDLIRFELKASIPAKKVFDEYSKYRNFQYSLELLLYQTIVEDGSSKRDDEFLEQLKRLIKVNEIHELNVVAKCLRKIEIQHWDKLLKYLKLSPQSLLDRSIELKQFETLGILVIIFLNYDANDELKLTTDGFIKVKDEDQLIQILKLLFENAENDDNLWDTAFEMLRFFKQIDPTKKLLEKGIAVLNN